VKRSPLVRRTPLQADPALAKKRPHRGLNPIPLKTRWAVHARDRWCVAGGCTGATHVHHRKLRSQGGDHSLANLILLCGPHHDAVHANPALGYELGFLVRSFDDPALVLIEAPWPDGPAVEDGTT
jgi:5-methylcytosine-specific restriction endonuclease McrA